MRCKDCNGRLRVRQSREPFTSIAGRSGREVEAELERLGLTQSVYVVRDRVCDRCGAVVGTAEIFLDDLRDLKSSVTLDNHKRLLHTVAQR